MTYQVLARKWRPKTFAELVGQEHVVTALSNGLTRGRLHHAYLLTGTRGVGKTTIARILAKSLNCITNGVSATPCGTCAACADIDAGRFVDLLELDAASNTGIDDMRAILDNARYAPTVGRYKVYLIDEVHQLSKPAFNSMLKTLEEPPEHVKFVLATTDPQKIPVTVLSRCLQFNLKPLPQALIAERLATILGAEGIASDAAALLLIAKGARGSMRDALSLLDQAIAYGGGDVREQAVRTMLGTVDPDYVYRIAAALQAGDGAALIAEADAMVARGVAFAPALDELASLFHRIAVVRSVPEAATAMDDGNRVSELAAPGTSPRRSDRLLDDIAAASRLRAGDQHGAWCRIGESYSASAAYPQGTRRGAGSCARDDNPGTGIGADGGAADRCRAVAGFCRRAQAAADRSTARGANRTHIDRRQCSDAGAPGGAQASGGQGVLGQAQGGARSGHRPEMAARLRGGRGC